MKENELRIGNYVYIPQTKTIEQIGCIEQNGRFILKDYKSSYSSISCLEPIPLTEEWLFQFGFVANNYNDEFELHPLTLDCEYTDKGEFITLYENTVLQSEIKYLHQLQNLYFALTGEELTLSE